MARYPFERDGLVSALDSIIGKTVGEIDVAGVLSGKGRNKGFVGDVIEQSVLKIPANSDQEPDIVIDGVDTEVKATGVVRKLRGGWSAKEPMSITAVSAEKIVGEEFYTSLFWHKTEHMLVVYYLYIKPGSGVKADYSQFVIKGYEFHVWGTEDIERLKNDWTQVRDFVRAAFEGDFEALMPDLSTVVNRRLLLLDTAPKYPHPPRFRLKRATVDTMAREHFGENLEQLPGRYTTMDDIDEVLRGVTRRFRGKTLGQVAHEVGIENAREAKNLTMTVLCRAFGAQSSRARDIELFAKTSFEMKTVTVSRLGGRTEDMKLDRAIDFDTLLDPAIGFDDSQFNEYFSQTNLICLVFREDNPKAKQTDKVFLGCKKLYLGEFMADAARLWHDMRMLVHTARLRDVVERNRDGSVRLSPKSKLPISAPNWPKRKNADGTTNALFIRGTATDARGKTLEIAGVKMYPTQNVWLAGSVVVARLAREEFI